MSKINLLFVVTKLELGGAQKQVLSLLSRLDREKYRLFLFTAYNGMIYPDALKIPDLKIKRSKFLERSISILPDLFSLIELCLFIRKNKILLVHTHSSKAGILGRIAAKLSGVQIILHTVHGWSFNDFQNPFLRGIYVRLEKICAVFTDKIIVVSDHDRLKGLAENIASPACYRLIRYGIDREDFACEGDSFRKEMGIAPSEPVVGMVACLKEQKAPVDFIRLAASVSARFKNARFVLVGDGVLRRSIEKFIRGQGLEKNVILTGWRRDIPAVLAGLDVFVLTSLWEGLPIAVLEAMASSLPVVATATGGIEEVIIDGRNGFLARPRDIPQMSERISQLLSDRELRVKMGGIAKERLSCEFSTSAMVAESHRLYDDLFRLRKMRPC